MLPISCQLRGRSFLNILIPLILFLILFSPTYSPLFERFTARDSYYSHGFLIPFVSLYLVWRKRQLLKTIPLKPQPLGGFILAGGVLLHLVSTFLKINFISYMAIPIVLLGTSLYLGGKRLTKELLFPIAFLVFMLPLPKVLIIGIAFKMKLLATDASTFIVNRLGIEAKGVGSTIYYPGGHLLVGDPCSGLRSLITFLALGALFTQFVQASIWRKNLLFISVIPIALLSNLVRITIMVLVGYVYGQKAVSGFLHDFSGIMVFVLGFIGLVMASKILRCPLEIKTI